MRTPAAAFAWEFLRRHRHGLLALLVAILVLGAIKIVYLNAHERMDLDEVTFALLLPVPLSGAFFYLLAVFTFGISGDIAARESMYPRRMFTLPVPSAALAGWPMLYGCAAMVLLWVAIRIVGVFPPDFEVPKYWPALFGASLIAWTQALTWMPYPVRGLRVAAAIVLLVSIDVVVFTALETKPSERTMLLLLAPFVPLAYGVAIVAVRRARRGEVPSWRFAERVAFEPSATARDFKSPTDALLWFEWRQQGRSLPLLVAIVVPVGLMLLFPFRDTPVIVGEIVVLSLLMPPFLAIFAAAAAGKSSSNASESYGITPFIATRPVPDRWLVLAKWRSALRSTIAAWLVVAIALPAALTWSEAWAPVVALARDVDGALGRPRAITLGIVIALVLIGATWKQLVQGFYIAMSGRDWAVKGVAFATLALVTIGFLALGWILDSRRRIVIAWDAIPWIMAALVALKLVLAWRVMRRGIDRELFTRKQLILGAISWDACVLGLYAVMALILPAILFRRHLLLLFAMLVVPFVRLAAAPLAVAGNRHR